MASRKFCTSIITTTNHRAAAALLTRHQASALGATSSPSPASSCTTQRRPRATAGVGAVRGYITSRVYDVAISDIAESDYRMLGQAAGVERLSPTTRVPRQQFPVEGIIHGDNARLFVPLVVSNGNVHKNVWFLLVTGSPVTFLTAETMSALGICAATVDSVSVAINGTSTIVGRSSPSFANVDLLGQDWLTKIGAQLQVDYQKGKIVITKGGGRRSMDRTTLLRNDDLL